MSGSVRRFEDLVAWQKARCLTAMVYRVTRQGEFARDFGLRGQIRRAAASVMSNIAEGFERGNPSEFYNYLRIAKASCAEVRSQPYVALDAEPVSEATFAELLNVAEEVSRVVGGLRVSVQRYRDGRGGS
jgi:four helix bundle protein